MGKVGTVLLSALVLVSLFLVKTVSAQSNYKIQMTDWGFSPNKIEINQGDVVTFVNVGQGGHWPASDIHPTHAIYPEFDPKKPIPSKQSWQFKFDKAGSWRMHDHLHPEFTGVIVVKGTKAAQNSSSSQTLSSKVTDLSDWIGFNWTKLTYQIFPNRLKTDLASVNFRNLAMSPDKSPLERWLKLIGPNEVLDKLMADSGNGSEFDCHQQAHQIGRVSYELFGAEAFTQGNPDCHSGYYHGTMEAFLRENGTDNLISNIDNLCNKFNTTFSKFECLHGVGHGIMAYEDYNMPFALDTCKLLDGAFAQQSCYGGVFMENILTSEGLGAGIDHKTQWVNTDPYFPCDGVSQDYEVQTQCYLMQTSRMLSLTHTDFSKVSKLCLGVRSDMIDTCFESMGRDAAGQALRDPYKTVATCQNAPATYRQDCIKGALNVIIDFWGPAVTDQPQQMCRIMIGDDKNYCYNLLSERLKEIFGTDNAKIKQICDYEEEGYREQCLESTPS